MNDDTYKDKIELILKTDGLLKNYIYSVIFDWIEKQGYEDPLNKLNQKQMQTVLLIFRMDSLSLKSLAKALKNN